MRVIPRGYSTLSPRERASRQTVCDLDTTSRFQNQTFLLHVKLPWDLFIRKAAARLTTGDTEPVAPTLLQTVADWQEVCGNSTPAPAKVTGGMLGNNTELWHVSLYAQTARSSASIALDWCAVARDRDSARNIADMGAALRVSHARAQTFRASGVSGFQCTALAPHC